MVLMKRVTTTLKLKFFDLNAVKVDLFAQTVSATTELAKELLRMSPKERKALTTAKVVPPLKSALSNQVIRLLKGKAGKQAKQFQVELEGRIPRFLTGGVSIWHWNMALDRWHGIARGLLLHFFLIALS